MFQRNSQTATIEQLPPALPEARPQGQTIVSDVFVPALQNLAGGIGTGVFVERVLWLSTDIPRANVNFWTLSVGLLVFGLATAIRAFRDEIVIIAHAYAERRNRQDFTELVQERDALQAQVVTLADEVQRLRQHDSGTADGRVH